MYESAVSASEIAESRFPGDGQASVKLPGRPEGQEKLVARIEDQVVEVSISSLRLLESPRLNGLDIDHARALAEAGAELPPILVCRRTMRVIDGMHRVRAAKLNERDKIRARFFDGEEGEAFLVAVRANVAHGLPLTLADRRAAAERIILSHPQLSDRSIAEVAGLAARTVRSIRISATGDHPQMSSTRVGSDGKVRPLNGAEGRRVAGEVLASKPDASLREIAKAAGISVGTAQDVRSRVRAGQDPVPLGSRTRNNGPSTYSTSRPPKARLSPANEMTDPQSILEQLRRDPSLRHTETGRALLLWLGSRMIVSAQWRSVINGIPRHNSVLVSMIARACAAAWTEFAIELESDAEGLA